MVYRPRISIMIFRYYNGNLICTNILINNVLLQVHPLVQLKSLSKLLTIFFSKHKNGLKRYTDKIYSRNGVNQMCKSNVDFEKFMKCGF